MPRAEPVAPSGPNPGRTQPVVANKVDGRTVAAVAYQAGFRGNHLVEAVAISFAEDSSHDATAQHLNHNGSVDVGLWQINSVHGIPIRTLFDPQANANAAWNISSKGTDWSPWSTYPALAAVHIPQALSTISALNHAGGAVKWLQNNPVNSSAPGGVMSPNLGDQLLNSTGLGGLDSFFGALTSGGTWIRVGEVVGGLALVIAGVIFVAKEVSGVSVK